MEDAPALARLGAEQVHLGFMDAIYRRPDVYDCDERLYGTIRDDAGHLARVAHSRFELEAAYPSALWYAPLGVGNHVDHQIAYMCGRALVRRGASVAFTSTCRMCSSKVRWMLDSTWSVERRSIGRSWCVSRVARSMQGYAQYATTPVSFAESLSSDICSGTGQRYIRRAHLVARPP